jgi:hypothetical protein
LVALASSGSCGTAGGAAVAAAHGSPLPLGLMGLG